MSFSQKMPTLKEIISVPENEAKNTFLDEWFAGDTDIPLTSYFSLQKLVQRHVPFLNSGVISDVFDRVLWARSKIYHEIWTFSGYFYNKKTEQLENPWELSFRHDFWEFLFFRSNLYLIIQGYNDGRQPEEFAFPGSFADWNGSFSQSHLDSFCSHVLQQMPDEVPDTLMEKSFAIMRLARSLKISDPHVSEKIVRIWKLLYYFQNIENIPEERVLLDLQTSSQPSNNSLALIAEDAISAPIAVNRAFRLFAEGHDDLMALACVPSDQIYAVAKSLGILKYRTIVDLVNAFPEDEENPYCTSSITLIISDWWVEGTLLFGRYFENYAGTIYELTHTSPAQDEDINSEDPWSRSYCALRISQEDMWYLPENEDVLLTWELPKQINVKDLFAQLVWFMQELEESMGVKTSTYANQWFWESTGDSSSSSWETLEWIPEILWKLKCDICDNFCLMNQYYQIEVGWSVPSVSSMRSGRWFLVFRAVRNDPKRPPLPPGWEKRLFEATSRFSQETGIPFPKDILLRGPHLSLPENTCA